MPSPQQVMEQCMAALFDNLSIHPSGVVTAWRDTKRGRYQVRVTPKRSDEGLWGWAYVFTDPAGNDTVAADSVSHMRVMIGRIQRWRWSL